MAGILPRYRREYLRGSSTGCEREVNDVIPIFAVASAAGYFRIACIVGEEYHDRMKTLVVYTSRYGNTEKITEA